MHQELLDMLAADAPDTGWHPYQSPKSKVQSSDLGLWTLDPGDGNQDEKRAHKSALDALC